MERRPDVGLDSYDRFFPNQDTLPQGGFGSLIALPMQRKPRQLGNSVFLDENLSPYDDQWAFLSEVRRIGRTEVEECVNKAEAKGHVIGVRLYPSEEEGETLPGSLLSRAEKRNRSLVLCRRNWRWFWLANYS
jgi:hypothetical protein